MQDEIISDSEWEDPHKLYRGGRLMAAFGIFSTVLNLQFYSPDEMMEYFAEGLSFILNKRNYE